MFTTMMVAAPITMVTARSSPVDVGLSIVLVVAHPGRGARARPRGRCDMPAFRLMRATGSSPTEGSDHRNPVPYRVRARWPQEPERR
jgi:hypothetical protein